MHIYSSHANGAVGQKSFLLRSEAVGRHQASYNCRLQADMNREHADQHSKQTTHG